MERIETQEKKGLMGFTLIELSIVLVIIGLIVGGVLVGQDLIKAAEVRATIGQYEKYNTAINTFRTKYNGMPGDLVAAQASAFGLFCMGASCAGGTGLGDGNGLIQSTGSDAAQLGEPLAFWRQLSDASLVDGSYGSGTNITAATGAATATTASTYFPPAKLGRGNYFTVGANSGINYYLLGAVSSINGTDATYARGLTPIESFNMDSKLDDGLPNTGSIQARGTDTDKDLFATLGAGNYSVIHASGSEASGDCQVGTDGSATTNTYSRGSVAGSGVGCLLRMRFN